MDSSRRLAGLGTDELFQIESGRVFELYYESVQDLGRSVVLAMWEGKDFEVLGRAFRWPKPYLTLADGCQQVDNQDFCLHTTFHGLDCDIVL